MRVRVFREPACDGRAGFDSRKEANGAITGEIVVDRDVDERGGTDRELVEHGLGALERPVAADAYQVREPLHPEGLCGLVSAVALEEGLVSLASKSLPASRTRRPIDRAGMPFARSA